MGIKQIFCLDYFDGTLANFMYKDIARDIREITDKLKPEIFMTFDERGVSGHIDHVAVAMITQYLFYRLDYVKTLMMFCISEAQAAATRPNYFIYIPTGYDPKHVDKIVDTTEVYDARVSAMKKHKSQMKDIRDILKIQAKLPKQELFFVKNK